MSEGTLHRLAVEALRWIKPSRLWRRRPVRARRILSVACTGHGASLAYLDRDGCLRASVLDRWTGVKNTYLFAAAEDHGLRHTDTSLSREILFGLARKPCGMPETRIFEDTIVPWTEWLLRGTGLGPQDIDLLVACDSNFATNGWALGDDLHRWFPNARVLAEIEHHQMHQCQAFWQSGFEEAAVLTLDTCGEQLGRLAGGKLAGTVSYHRRGSRPKVLAELRFPESSIGLYYDLATTYAGFGVDQQGKTMGLAPYGESKLFERFRGRLELCDDGSFRFLPEEELRASLDELGGRRPPGGELRPLDADIAFLGQAVLEEVVAHAFAAARRLTGSANLAYAGGVALNSVANDAAFRRSGFERLYVATNPGDTGQALGCVLWGAARAGWPPSHEIPEYLGPEYTAEEIEAAARRSDFSLARPEELEETAAACLANGHILARWAGRSEFGPRALGNRSILCDPSRPDMKSYLNHRVKHRESFRPFAPSVLEEHAGEWFEIDGRSSYMLRVCPVRPEAAKRIPAVTHVDGTARVQTVSAAENPGYYRLISAFHRQTGVPMVLNTSFNVAGKPIVETPDDAVACFSGTEIDVLLLGPFVLSKRPLEEYRERSR